ncbi:YibE/F family protein [Sporosarcina luteola]|uniref:YibE/F family protein n=1 Tax=Bacillales TaxID=1385 RepID=UPI00203C1BC5|nr:MULTISPECIES: YibE/F family protein [Bacillales]MCM3639493.1 YibE/F family protein [Sporosarcina luteola]
MNVIVLLAIILFLLMMIVGGKKGVRSFISLFLNFGVIMFTIFLMTNPQWNPIIITIIACVFISCISLFFINEVNSKTIAAFISTIITIVLLLFFIVIVTKYAMIQGFGEEEINELGVFSLFIGIDFTKLLASVIIMSTIGAIMDVAISMAASMHEIFNNNPSISRRDLFASGLSVGRDILGADTNTLFFVFFGGYLALLLWFKDLHYSIGGIINSKIFSAEMISILCAGIGVALSLPIAAGINAYLLIRNREKRQV